MATEKRPIKKNKAYKFRAYPAKEQEILFAKTFGSARFIYNQMLADKIKHYEEHKETLYTTPASYKGVFPWLKEVDSLALANAQLDLQVAYNNFFRDPKVGYPVFKSKHRSRKSYTTNNQKGNIRIEGKFIKLPKVGMVRIKQHRQIPENHIIKSVTVSLTPSGKYYVSILTEYTVDGRDHVIDENKTLGLDFAMAELFVDSNGVSASYPRYYRQMQAKLAKEQRKLSLCKKGSNNRRKQKIKVARIHEKIANQREDFLHKLSNQIANDYDLVCIEDLNMKGMSQALNFGKSVSDNGWGKFTAFLAYKLEDKGKKLIKIDKWYASSKTCSSCGTKKDSLALSERTYVCEHCGVVMNRDHNAAINIQKEGLRLYSVA